MRLIICLHLVLMLRMSGAASLLPLHAFMACMGITFSELKFKYVTAEPHIGCITCGRVTHMHSVRSWVGTTYTDTIGLLSSKVINS
jgi:hypothetical protein